MDGAEDVAIAAAAVASSWVRLSLGLLLSLAFSFTVGVAAGRNKKVESIAIPILDVLQSVPILGFFPIALFGLYRLSPQVGPEIAAIFLIFTSQAWNIAFGVYESARTVPSEVIETSRNMGMGGLERFFRLYIPSSLPKVFHNIPPSWSNSLYFLVASEILAFGALNVKLFGLGSVMADFVAEQNLVGMGAALTLLILSVVATNVLVFIPLMRYGERFRFEVEIGEVTPVWFDRVAGRLSDIRSRFSRIELRRPGIVSYPEIHRAISGITRRVHVPKSVVQFAVFVVLAYFLVNILFSWRAGLEEGLRGVVRSLAALGVEGVLSPMLFSIARVSVAVVFSVAWSIPLAIYLNNHRAISSIAVPLMQVTASIPATITYPILASLPWLRDETFAFLLIILGTQWYVFFSVLGGMNNIPHDEISVADLYQIKGLSRLKALYLPHITLPLITGCLVATGGAWNTLVVAERLRFGGITSEVSAPGLGKSITLAAESGDIHTLTALVAVMTLAVVVLNRVFWKRLYNMYMAKLRLPEVE